MKIVRIFFVILLSFTYKLGHFYKKSKLSYYFFYLI